MSNVVNFPSVSPLTSDEMLRAIAEEKPAKCFVIVWPEDGSLPTYHCNTTDTPCILYRLQEFIHGVFSGRFIP